MLVLSRRRESAIQIGADIKITVLEIRNGRVKLGVNAPNAISVRRANNSPPRSRPRPCRRQCEN